MVELVEYRGWKNNLKLSNADCELVVTLDVGPRVIAYRLPGGFNVLKNYDQMMGGTGENPGSWWPVWKEWLIAHAGPTKKAPSKLGSNEHPPTDDAPGAYCLEDGKPKRARSPRKKAP